MFISIQVTRSASWISAQRVATGENVPATIDVKVDPADCTTATRELLLKIGNGTYTDTPRGVCFKSDYTVNSGSYGAWGTVPICVDSDSPTIGEIEAAIAVAFDIVAGKKAEAEQLQAERNAKAEADKIEKERKAAAIASARELLADELAKIKTLASKVETLSDVLRNIPIDAIRGAVKRMANNPETIAELTNEIENASDYYIFSNRNDDDSESDDSED